MIDCDYTAENFIDDGLLGNFPSTKIGRGRGLEIREQRSDSRDT